MKKISLVFAALVLVFSGSFAQKTEWTLDKVHSNIGFTIDHMVVSEVNGAFDDYVLNVKADKPDFTDAAFDVTIKTKSVNTKETNRDNHLKSADFFDSEKYADITFKGKSFKKIKGNIYKVAGDLTIKDVTKSITLEAKFMGIVKDGKGNLHAGVKVTGIIDRYIWGLKYNSSLDNGGVMIGQKVTLQASFELIQKK